MGAVHGVYLKYVALAAVSYAGYVACQVSEDGSIGQSSSSMAYYGQQFFAYSCLVNGAVAVMFKLRRGMSLIGKNGKTGEIPLWSYVLWFPFHAPTVLYTHLHNLKDQKKKPPVPPASEVLPGWWVGGCYGHLLQKSWGGVVDLTSEFPESCISTTKRYMLAASWDGVPPPPDKLEAAAVFAAEAHKIGDVLVHCAHGKIFIKLSISHNLS